MTSAYFHLIGFAINLITASLMAFSLSSLQGFVQIAGFILLVVFVFLGWDHYRKWRKKLKVVRNRRW